MTIIGNKELFWKRKKGRLSLELFFRKKLIAKLIPHKDIKNHYHIKFKWRDKPTPEFFNLSNARENTRIYVLRRLQSDQEKLTEARTAI